MVMMVAAAAAVMLALGSSPALAKGKKGGKGMQGGPGGGPFMHVLKALQVHADDLGLSAYQKSEIEEKVKACREEVAPLKEEAQALRKEMMALVKAKKLDKKKIKATHKKIQALHQQIGEKKMDAALEVLDLLSVDQRTELFELIGKDKSCKGDCAGQGKGKGKEKGKKKGW